jgi:hypothetical protein
MVVEAKVISLHWEEQACAVPEATLEVEHANGDRQLFVIAIVRMTDRLPGQHLDETMPFLFEKPSAR